MVVVRAVRWWSLLLVPGGFVAGHELGYQSAAALGAGPAVDGGSHGYLGAVLLVSAPFACAVLARSLVAGLRDELPPVRWATLAAAQSALFLAIELTEHAAAGIAPAAALVEPAVLLGLAAQLAVAAALVRIVRTSRDVGGAIAAARRARPRRARPAPWPPAQQPVAVAVVPVSSLSRRGPPSPPLG